MLPSPPILLLVGVNGNTTHDSDEGVDRNQVISQQDGITNQPFFRRLGSDNALCEMSSSERREQSLLLLPLRETDLDAWRAKQEHQTSVPTVQFEGRFQRRSRPITNFEGREDERCFRFIVIGSSRCTRDHARVKVVHCLPHTYQIGTCTCSGTC